MRTAVRLAALLCMVAGVLSAQSCVPAGTSVTAVTNRIIESIGRLPAADAQSAGPLIEGMKSSLNSLASATGCFQAVAQRGHEQCIGQVSRFTLTVADFETAESVLNTRLREWDVELQRATTAQQLNEEQLRRLQADMDNVRRSLDSRRRELAKYDWIVWVCPPCKLIAEAISGDEATIRRLEGDMRAMQTQGQPLNASRQQLEKARQDGVAALDSIKKTMGEVASLRAEIHQELGDLKAATAFLTQANVFWGEAGQILTLRAGPDLARAARESQRKLDAPAQAVSFSAGKTPAAATLKETLLRFAKATDDGTSFLLKSDAPFCAVGAHVSIYGPAMNPAGTARVTDKTVYITAYGLENRTAAKVSCTFTAGNPAYSPQTTGIEPKQALKVNNKGDLVKSYYRPIKPDARLTPTPAELAAYPGWKQPDGFSLSCSQPNSVYAYFIYQDR